MSCAAILCLSGLFIEGSAGYIDLPKAKQMEWYGQTYRYSRKYDMNHTSNPMGNLAIGHEWDTPKWRVSIELRHDSWLGTGKDRGMNGAWTSVRYKPFAKR
jgi:hypothetical protein